MRIFQDDKWRLRIVALLGLLSLGVGIRWAFDIGTPVATSAELARVDEIEFVMKNTEPLQQGGDYFVNYRLQREQTRQETKAMLAPLLESSVEETKAKAQEKWLALSYEIEKEDQIENLLKIQGFKDVVADVNENGVHAIIYAISLNKEEVSIIQHIIYKTTNVDFDRISIAYKS